MDKASISSTGYRKLADDETVGAHDYFEWMANAFTRLDPGSVFVGQRVNELPPVTLLTWQKRPSEVYRDEHSGGIG